MPPPQPVSLRLGGGLCWLVQPAPPPALPQSILGTSGPYVVKQKFLATGRISGRTTASASSEGPWPAWEGSMTVRHGSVEKFHDDELIVAIPQLSVVREELQDFGVEIGDRGIEENGVLGLARLSELKGIEKAVRKLERDRSVGQEIKAYRKLRHEAHPDAPPVSDLALLIYGVKLRLARRYPGWQIAIGKNYRPSLVRGNPHTAGEAHPKPPTDGVGRPLPHTDGVGHPLPHTDPHTDGEGRPTTTGEPVTSAIA